MANVGITHNCGMVIFLGDISLYAKVCAYIMFEKTFEIYANNVCDIMH